MAASKTLGVVNPPDSILNLFGKIQTGLKETETETSGKLKSYDKLMLDNFGKYLHNRIGTMIRDNEKDYIKKMDVTPFKRGE